MKKIDLKSIVLWGVLGAFAIGGAFQSMFGVNNPVLAKVGSSSIKAVDVRRFIPLIPIPEGMYKESSSVQNYVFFQALNMAVQRELVNLECKRLGFIVSNFQVKESIKRNKNFMESGSFSRSKYLGFDARVLAISKRLLSPPDRTIDLDFLTWAISNSFNKFSNNI